MKLLAVASVLLIAFMVCLLLPVLAHNSSGSDCSSLLATYWSKVKTVAHKLGDLISAYWAWYNESNWFLKKAKLGLLGLAKKSYDDAKEESTEAYNHWKEHCGGG